MADRCHGADRGAVPPVAVATKRATPEAIPGEILIVREPGSGSREAVEDAFAARGVRPARTLEIGSTEAIKWVVAAVLGLAIVSAATIKDQLALGKLKVILWRDFSIKRSNLRETFKASTEGTRAVVDGDSRKRGDVLY